MTKPLATMEVEHRPGVAVVRLSGEIDLSNAERLERGILTEAAEAPAVVIDLSDVLYVDSAGVVLLQRLGRTLLDQTRALRLVVGDDTAAARIVSLTSLDKALPVDRSCDAALAALTQAAPD